MTNPVAQLQGITHGDDRYDAITLWCPGCQYYRDGDPDPAGGLHMLPVTGDGSKRPTWSFDGNLQAPTLAPSILTRTEHTRRYIDGELKDVGRFVCHSFLRNGVWEFLGDCTHPLAGQHVPMVPLPDWVVHE